MLHLKLIFWAHHLWEDIVAESSNGSDVLKKFGTYAAIVGVLLASGKVLWGGGGTEARFEEKVQILTERQQRDEQEFARKDVLDERLLNIEKSQQKLESQLDKETALLEQLQRDIMKRR